MKLGEPTGLLAEAVDVLARIMGEDAHGGGDDYEWNVTVHEGWPIEVPDGVASLVRARRKALGRQDRPDSATSD